MDRETELLFSGEILTVPKEHWRLSAVDWKAANLAIPESEFGWIGLQVKTSELFKLFPRPEVPHVSSVTGSIAGGALIIDSERDTKFQPFKRSRGRQPKGDGVIADAVDKEFSERLATGRLPPIAESICQEAIVFVKDMFGEDIGRSTAQRYLAAVLHARKSRPQIRP